MAAEPLNRLAMGAPTDAAMFLGDDVVPSPADQQEHVENAVAALMAAYGRRP